MMNYSDVPLKLAAYLGVVFAAIGLIAAIVVLIMKLVNPAMQAGWPSMMCTMLFLFGILFMIIGILGEYIGRVLFTVNRSPQYVIRDVVTKENGKKVVLPRPANSDRQAEKRQA